MVTRSVVFIVVLFLCQPGVAKLKVVTTTTTLADLVRVIGGLHVEAVSITKKGQDPHFVEAKPSYMIKVRRADLLVSVGLGLEVGWIGLVRRGARSPKLLPGKKGSFEAGHFIKALEIPLGKIDRALGDVHPEGNPHFHLDPSRFLKMAEALTERISELDAKNSLDYQSNLQAFKKVIDEKMTIWQERIDKAGIKRIIAYHKSLNYFFSRFGIVPSGYLEPKPGVAPSARHIVGLIRHIKEKKIRCVLNEDYFELTAAKRIALETEVLIVPVPVEVQSSYVNLIETLVLAIESCVKGPK